MNLDGYIEAAVNLIEHSSESKNIKLSKIDLESVKQQDRKMNAVLEIYDYISIYIVTAVKWTVQYKHRYQDEGIVHSIVSSKPDATKE